MPFYHFSCECGREKDSLRAVGCEEIPCECGNEMQRVFSSGGVKIKIFADERFLETGLEMK